MRQHRQTPAVVIALLALVVALCGSAAAGYAAGKANGDSIIKKKSLSGNRLKPDTVEGDRIDESSLGTVPRAARADLATKVPAPTSGTFTLTSGWHAQEDSRTPGWRVDVSGLVHLQGVVDSKLTASATNFATLPAALAPSKTIYLLGGSVYSGVINTIFITPDGVISSGTGNEEFVSLEGMSFYPG